MIGGLIVTHGRLAIELLNAAEMAADPPSAAVLLGLGFTSLSVNLGAYSRIKRMVRSVSMAQLRELAAQILKMQKPKEVEEKVRATVYRS